jgi:hypothetical protein
MKDESAGICVSACPSLSVNALIFNLASRSLGLLENRQYVAKNIDRDGLLARCNLGVGQVPRGPIPIASSFYRSWKGIHEAYTSGGELINEIEILCDSNYNSHLLDDLGGFDAQKQVARKIR